MSEAVASPRLQARKPTQARGSVRVEQIRAAAVELLSRQDVSGLTVHEVARAAGVGIGTFYHYYPTKEALLLELRARLFAETAVSLTASFADPARRPKDFTAGLTALIQEWITLADSHRGLERAIAGMAMENEAVAAELARQEQPLIQLVAALIRQYQDRLRPCQPAAAAAAVVVLVEALVQRTMREPGLARRQAWLVPEVARMVGHFLLPDARYPGLLRQEP